MAWMIILTIKSRTMSNAWWPKIPATGSLILIQTEEPHITPLRSTSPDDVQSPTSCGSPAWGSFGAAIAEATDLVKSYFPEFLKG